MEKRRSPKSHRLADEPIGKGVQTISDRSIDFIIDRATEVIGDLEEAMRWLGEPVRGLNFATPISLLATDEGRTRVTDLLGQIEHGIW